MSLPIILPSDFSGWIKISTNGLARDERLQEYIDLFYDKYLRLIIGDVAYTDIINNDFQKYNDLLNGVTYLNENKNVICDPLLDVIKNCIYVEYQRDNFDNAGVGKVKPNESLSTSMNGTELSLISMTRWNEGNRKINGSISDFLEFYSEITNNITNVSNAGSIYTIETNSTLYLDDGLNVLINGVKYQVSNVIENTSFDITLDTPIIFPSTYSYKPFELIELCEIGIMTVF